MQLWMMGVFLGPKNGKAIGEFFKALIDSMIGNDNDAVKKAEAAAKMSLSIAALVGTLTLCLVALVILWKSELDNLQRLVDRIPPDILAELKRQQRHTVKER